jgi:hypothetical protein
MQPVKHISNGDRSSTCLLQQKINIINKLHMQNLHNEITSIISSSGSCRRVRPYHSGAPMTCSVSSTGSALRRL